MQYRRDEVCNDLWQEALTTGDCEDIALANHKELVKIGYPRGAFRLAVCLTERGTPHAVLIATTSTLGDWVLDNRWLGARRWQKLPYKCIAREVPGSLMWERIVS